MENGSKKMNKSSLLILIIVGVIVLAVVGYGIWQTMGKGTGSSSSSALTVSGALELNEENLEGRWICTGETVAHELTFSKEQKLSYQKFETGNEMPVLSTTDDTYKIEGNTLTLSISVLTGDISETCQASLTKDTLTLTGTGESPSHFAGTYRRTEPEESSSTAESNLSEPESSASPESSSPLESSSKPQNDQWKPVYISYIESLHSDEWQNFKLINLDGDSIPELYIEGSTTAQGNLICTYSNGKMVSENLRSGITKYNEGSNRLHVRSGNMGLYFDTIYSIQNGAFMQLHSGQFELRDPYGTSYEENDTNYQYTWDGKQILKAEYDQKLNQEVGSGKAAYEAMITKSEVITKIANW
ncbi:hypothetical protein H6A12_03415 [Phocea massiliensis]|uniref:Uncharacterized protein n=1 Tax=Merdimmobilis hominis TaxID=2897707 RepID=A0A938X3M4_9FIRM|nr:hypothetical protein [Merdimmobilis hominis]MBM6920207.1 hypothetical protein [Merdimmobilis hominis]